MIFIRFIFYAQSDLEYFFCLHLIIRFLYVSKCCRGLQPILVSNLWLWNSVFGINVAKCLVNCELLNSSGIAECHFTAISESCFSYNDWKQLTEMSKDMDSIDFKLPGEQALQFVKQFHVIVTSSYIYPSFLQC